MQLRPVTGADLDLVCGHRERMFRESGRPPDAIEEMVPHFRDWLVPHLAAGTYFGWIAEVQGEVIGGIGMMEIEWPPHPFHPTSAKRGYILNVFVEPGHRKQGVATKMMEEACREAHRRGLGFVILHATEHGRPLYERLGWKQTAEMALIIEATSA